MSFEVSEKQAYGIILWFGFLMFTLGLSCGITLVNLTNTIIGLI